MLQKLMEGYRAKHAEGLVQGLGAGTAEKRSGHCPTVIGGSKSILGLYLMQKDV